MLIRKILLFIIPFFVLYSCGTANYTVSVSKKGTKTTTNTPKRGTSGSSSRVANSVIRDAESYLGVKYNFGGNDRSGFDCSGLVCTVYEKNNMKLPRRSEDQGREGSHVSKHHVKPGDLLFFATSGGNKVSHVGIVHSLDRGDIKFIHASTSKGVIISSLSEKYWDKAYLFARRVL